MKRSFALFLAGSAILGTELLLLESCAHPQVSPEASSAVFATKVKPVLEYYCIECHDMKSAGKYGGLILETRTTAMQTGRHAPVIRPGSPDDSLLYTVLRLGHEEPLGMPPSPDKISDEQLEGIRQWIRDGAFWPPGEEGRLKLPTH